MLVIEETTRLVFYPSFSGYFWTVNAKRLFNDGRGMAGILTWKRFLNGFLILFSYQLSRFLKQPVHLGFPLSVSVEPTTSCNLRCPECPSGLRSFSRPTGMLEPAFFSRLLDQLAPRLWSINFYFQGEPFLNRNLTAMISEAVLRNVFTSTSTNAHYLDEDTARKTVESGLHRLIISIDGTTQQTYEQYRIGGNLEKVIEGTRRVLYWKGKLKSRYPQVIFQFLVVKPNEHQLTDVLELATELGVDEVRFKTAQVYDFENGNALIPENDDYSRYRQGRDGKWKLKNKLLNRCWRMWQGCVITWDGAVVPCCFDKDARHQLGKLNEQPFSAIWNSREYKQFRASVFSNRQGIDICTNCTEGTKVWS